MDKSSIYKVEKQEDSLRRRFFLHTVKNQQEKEYLSDLKYKEKLITMHKKEPYNSMLSVDVEDGEEGNKIKILPRNSKRKGCELNSFLNLRDSINSIFHESSLENKIFSFTGHYFKENISNEMNSILKKQKNKHFLMKDLEDRKPLTRQTSQKTSEIVENSFSIDYKYKCFAEKISLKGAIWGQLIIFKNSLIFCSLNDLRPEEDSIFK